jgi:STAS domain-containing protein
MEPSIIRFAIDGPIDPVNISSLCDRLQALVLDTAGSRQVVCDVADLRSPDAAAIDAIARLQLLARRLGLEICFDGASTELVDLLWLAGLLRVVPLNGRLGVEPRRQPEQREERRRVEEERDPGDSIR